MKLTPEQIEELQDALNVCIASHGTISVGAAFFELKQTVEEFIDQETKALKHDIERSQDHATELATENEKLRKALSESAAMQKELPDLTVVYMAGIEDGKKRAARDLASEEPVAYMIRHCIGARREWSKWTPCSIEDYELRKEYTDIFQFRALVDAGQEKRNE